MAAREAEQKERRIMEVERANFDEKDAEEIVVSGVSVICVNRWAKEEFKDSADLAGSLPSRWCKNPKSRIKRYIVSQSATISVELLYTMPNIIFELAFRAI